MNLLFLALIVFVPFPTSVMSDYGSTRTATIFYAASLAAIGLVLCFIILYATRATGSSPTQYFWILIFVNGVIIERVQRRNRRS